MAYLDRYKKLIHHIEQRIEIPAIKEILLPAISESDDIKDNFGFVILDDGSTGPFYTCLDDTLEWLHNHRSAFIGLSATTIAAKLDGKDIPLSALALGAFNAMSLHIMSKAGFDPSGCEKSANTDSAANHIGMVGFFRPLIERYLSQGKRVTLIEKQPERVPDTLPVELHTSPESLAACDVILCTASTLINNTIESIIDAAKNPAKINLIGPSASGLPDLLFDLGVQSAGGFVVKNLPALTKAVSAGESWGAAGLKFQLTPDAYPGIEALMDKIDEAHLNE